ncbi:MAG: nucleotidyltransferase [bacterium]|nr:nucleotidyltransferase [bacterium]
MDLKPDFDVFMKEIRPTEDQRKDLQSGHRILRERLKADEILKDIIVSDFLQGSYRRSTAIRPKSDLRADVDIVVVTKLAESKFTPAKAMDVFKPFLEKYYKDKWKPQGRSFGIEMSYVELDLVLTSAPSEVEYGIFESASVMSDNDLVEAPDWKLHKSWIPIELRQRPDTRAFFTEMKDQPEWKPKPLRIPDRDTNKWEDTHPLEQIRWTRDKNAKCNGHFVNVVKAIKWWRLEKYEEPQHPKGFPLERLIGECCPDGIESLALGITLTLEKIVSNYGSPAPIKPKLPDYGVPSHDVFARVSFDDFSMFYDQTVEAAKLARRALDSKDRIESGNLWRELLGNKFPKPPEEGSSSREGFTPPRGPAVPASGRFA